MRYSSNFDKSKFQAYKIVNRKRTKVAELHLNLLDVRRHYFGKGRFSCTGCVVIPTEASSDEDLAQLLRDLPRLKKQRLNYVLEHLDRYLLEAQMVITGRTTHKKYSCETLPIDDITSDDLKRYGSAVKSRATILGNDLVKKAEQTKSAGKKSLRVCHSYIKDGYDEYSDDTWAY